MNRSLYTLLYHIALPFILLRLLIRSRQAPAYRRRIGERLSLKLPALKPGGIWVHAVSVGETIAAAPMIRQLLEWYPDLPLTITCMTPTGSERVRALFGDRVQHCYLPYDLPWSVSRFLDRTRPRLAVIMETELWPNYIHQCARRGIPTVLASGRLSERSAKGYGRFPRLVRPMLESLSWLAVQTEAEAERFRALGAAPKRVSVIGSIKFDLSPDPQTTKAAEALRATWGDRPVWIAASTHTHEDEIVLIAHQRVRERFPDALLILVPRHPERFDTVFGTCWRKGFTTQRRSLDEPIVAETAVLLGDTMGELMFLYGLADCAFVGGSLVARGGHNLLEPAVLGKPVITGPYVFNFLDIAAQLREAGALEEVSEANGLGGAVCALLEDAAKAEAMREAGFSVMRANQGSLGRLLIGLSRQIKAL